MDKYFKFAIEHYAITMCNVKKSQCKKEKIEFNLTPEWYIEKLQKGCALSGLPFSWADGGHNAYNMSVDRINPTGGYTVDNCHMILRGINMLKLNGTVDDVYNIAEAIVKRKKGG